VLAVQLQAVACCTWVISALLTTKSALTTQQSTVSLKNVFFMAFKAHFFPFNLANAKFYNLP